MVSLSRREFLAAAAGLGATVIWGRARPTISRVRWQERRDLYPEGVASGDPRFDSVLLWTRRPFVDDSDSNHLTVEVAEDEGFRRVIATAPAPVSAESGWTCRVLVGGLRPSRVYWYRFCDSHGFGSRIGRTITAPHDDDPQPVRFAFVSCQNANLGAQNAFRRMIFEDERASESDRLGFVLYLGDFIYELVWYSEDRPQGMYDRRIRDIGRYANGEKIRDFHIPTTLEDYRAVYRAYLHDPDLQDARARWPFVPIWDNHEFSWQGWQSLQKFGNKTQPRQTRKVAANQAWFEYQPARIAQPSGSSLDRFDPPKVMDAPITHFDEHGLGKESNNLAAIGSLTGYRAMRWGRHVELILTDQRSFRSEPPLTRPEVEAFSSEDFPEFVPEEVQQILDAGKTFNGGHPPPSIHYGGTDVPNFRKDEPPQTLLGAEQKAWFLERLKHSRATWKIWGATTATLAMRADPQNLPAGLTNPWPGAGYVGFGGDDHSVAYLELAEIYDLIDREKITGFTTIAGDRHSFWAGFAAKNLPPAEFKPVGIAFVTGSISAPGMAEALEHGFPKSHPLRPLFLADQPGEAKPQPAVNLLLQHGVRTCLKYAQSGDLATAKALSNPANAPHVSFVDMGGHGYSVVRASATEIEIEFVCIPRPLERSTSADGGPLRYRVIHRAKLWRKDEHPVLEQNIVEGDARFST